MALARPAYSDEQVLKIRAEICAVGLSVIRSEGIRALTLRNVAKKLNRTSAALYRYFASKDELLAAICADGFDELGASLRSARVTASNPREGARNAIRAYFDFALNDPERFGLMYSLDQQNFMRAPAVRKERERAFGQATAIARDAIDGGWLKGDPALIAHLLWASCHGLSALALSGQLDLGCSQDDLIEPMIDRLVPQ